MEIAKDHAPNTSSMCLIQPHPYFASDQFGSSSAQGFDHEQHIKAFEEGSCSERPTGIGKNVAISSSSSLSSPSSTNSDGLVYPTVKYGSEDGHSVISFKAGYGNFAHAATGSLLSFDQNERFSQNCLPRMISTNQDDYSIWEDNLHYNYQKHLNSNCSAANPRLLDDSCNIKTTNSNASTSSEVALGWLSSEPNANATISSIQGFGRQDACLSKRPYMGESTQAAKKQCTEVMKTTKSKSKDPQSIAAKNRRERISERLKILQDLVPNGSKVDLVTMLEKAISYVKFLQLQVKVLATDEFWPTQGGKAPDLSQVREAIDAILASQRDRNSSPK